MLSEVCGSSGFVGGVRDLHALYPDDRALGNNSGPEVPCGKCGIPRFRTDRSPLTAHCLGLPSSITLPVRRIPAPKSPSGTLTPFRDNDPPSGPRKAYLPSATIRPGHVTARISSDPLVTTPQLWAGIAQRFVKPVVDAEIPITGCVHFAVQISALLSREVE